jgi:hypothetical protein
MNDLFASSPGLAVKIELATTDAFEESFQSPKSTLSARSVS